MFTCWKKSTCKLHLTESISGRLLHSPHLAACSSSLPPKPLLPSSPTLISLPLRCSCSTPVCQLPLVPKHPFASLNQVDPSIFLRTLVHLYVARFLLKCLIGTQLRHNGLHIQCHLATPPREPAISRSKSTETPLYQHRADFSTNIELKVSPKRIYFVVFSCISKKACLANSDLEDFKRTNVQI